MKIFEPKFLRFWRSSNALSAIGVLAAGFLLAEVNFVAARHYQRWDFSSEQDFSLSAASETMLKRAKQPLEARFLLSRADPLLLDLDQLFAGYQALQPNISYRQIDPERQGTEYRRLRQEAQANGANPELEDIALILRYGDKLRSLGRDKLVRLATQKKGSRGVEAAISNTINQIIADEKKLMCVLSGHGEKSILNQGPQGLSAFRRSLKSSDVTTKTVSLTPVNEECTSLALVGPTQTFTPDDLIELNKWVNGQRNFLFALDPIVDREGRITSTGLTPFTLKFGVKLGRRFILERDQAQKLSAGIGEEFLGQIKTHPITQAFHSGNRRRGLKVTVRAAGPLELRQPAQALLTTSEKAVTMDDLQSLESSLDAQKDPEAPFTVVAISQYDGSQAAFWGSSEMITNQLFGDRKLTGNRVLLEAAVAELLDQPLMFASEAAQESSYALKVAESDLQDIFYYVLFWMPGLAALTGCSILYARRRRDQRGTK